MTFLFTDIEGSTRLWEQHPSTMRDTVATHDRLMRSILEGGGGYVFATAGDGFGVAFRSTGEAAAAAVNAQAALADTDWAHGGPLRVRMAIDAGVADERDGDYFGPSVNRAARVMSEAAGGQILLTSTAADLLRHDLPPGTALRPEGNKTLKGLPGAVALFELTDERPGRSWRPWVLGVAGMAVLAVGAAFVLQSRSGEADVETTATPSPAVTTATDEAESPFLWRRNLGGPAESVVIVGGVAVTAVQTPDGTTVAGFGAATGSSLWEEDFDVVYAVRAQAGQLVLVHRDGLVDRIDLLDPVSGTPISGCGLVLPTALMTPGKDGFTTYAMNALSQSGATATVVDGEAFLLLGVGTPGQLEVDANSGLLSVDFTPEGRRCHTVTRYEEGVTRWPPILSGPVLAGGSVFVGDSGTLHSFAQDSFEKQWDYFPATGQVAGYDGGVRHIAARAVQFQYPGGIRTEVMLYIVDGESTLHKVDAGVLSASIATSGHPIALTDEAVFIVGADNDLIAMDHTLHDVLWRASPESIAAGPLVVEDAIVLATNTGVIAFDPTDGTTLLSTETEVPVAAVTAGEGLIVLVDANGELMAIRLPGHPLPDLPAPETTSIAAEPVAVATEFLKALESGSPAAVVDLLGVDLHFPEQYETSLVVAPWALQWWFEPETREQVLGRVAFFQALNARVDVGACETAERRDGTGVEVACEVTHSDDFHDVFGVTFSGTTHIVVRDGLVRQLFGGEWDRREYDPGSREGIYFRMKVGQWRGMDLGLNTGEWFERTWEWAQEQRTDGFTVACGDVTPKAPSVACGRFLLEVAPEFAATLP